MEALSPWHILIVATAAAVLFFGWRQLPDMSRSLGRSLRIFKTEIKGLSADATREAHDLAAAAGAATAPDAGAPAEARVASVRPLPIPRSEAC